MKPGTVPPVVAVVLAMCAVAFVTSIILELPILDGFEVYAMIIGGMAVYWAVLKFLGHRPW